MLRFVRSPDGMLCFDVSSGRLPGRGAWIHPRRDLFEMAVKKNLFSKVFGEKTVVSSQCAEGILTQLQKQIFSLLGLARKAGELVMGALKITQVLGAGDIAFVLAATDSSDRERKQLENKVPVYLFGTKQEFSNLTLQKEQAYFGLKKGALAEVIKDTLFKYQTFLGKEGL